MGSTNWFFKPGQLSTILDGGAGSSGKGKIGSYVTENADNWQFCCNTFAPQAGHWVKLESGETFFYQSLNSCAYNHEKFEKLYLGPGSIIELPALLRELEENNIPRSKVGISPIIPILDEEMDQGFERGVLGFDGAQLSENHEGTVKFGSTCHGVGSVAARRVLRRPSLRVARDVPELKDMICDVPAEITARLDSGQAGLLEIAQGYQLSLMHERFFPYCTSRNVTVAHGLSDMFLPTKFAGQVLINLRTYPIRINSKKYIAKDDGRHLTWPEVEKGVPHEVYDKGSSGDWYPDQEELSWEELTRMSGSPDPIWEMTSVTKLPRRVATFSRINVADAMWANDTGHGVHLSLNFANYVDHGLTGKTDRGDITAKFDGWLTENLGEFKKDVRFLGTGAMTHETIEI